jgi:LysR family hydrogen peroxide-inducible transcriptional activator
VELRQVRYFVAVAHEQHFTRAALALGIAQPALSQQLRTLERELGVTLLQRTSRRVRLTPAGEAFLARAEQLLADADRAQREMEVFAGLGRGRLAVGVIPSLNERWLAGLFARFNQGYPGIELMLREETTAGLVDAVAKGELDLALIHYTSDADRAGLVCEPLFDEDVVLAVGLDHRLAGVDRVALDDLRDERWVLLKPGSVTRQSVVDACAALGFHPHVFFESSSLTPVRALASAGLGIAVLPRSVAAAEGPPIATVRLDPPALVRTVALAWRPAPFLSPAAAAFVDIAREDWARVRAGGTGG